MHITGMAIVNIPPFKRRVEFKFDERVNVLIGANATGKSTVLRLIRRIRHTGEQGAVFSYKSHGFAEIAVSDNWPRDVNRRHDVIPKWDELPHVEIAASRSSLPLVGPDYMDSMYLPSISSEETIESILEPKDALSHFHGHNVERLVNLLIDGTEDHEQVSARYNFNKATSISLLCAKCICDETMENADPQNLMIRRFGNVGDDSLDTIPEAYDGLVLDTIDTSWRDGGRRLRLHDLSAGMQSSLLWIRFLALKILHHYGYVDGWENRPAILLIDEIENHLHPTWQRRVIPALLKHFPGLQIFATTHSPFVVAGLKAGQVHMLKRDANGVVAASTNEHDIIGWTTDEILRTFMGVDEPTDQLTIDRRERLLELRRKGPLTGEEAAEMEELRRQVNEDFLSSSTPLEAQRERYGDMMLEFLRSRQSDLSQDGS